MHLMQFVTLHYFVVCKYIHTYVAGYQQQTSIRNIQYYVGVAVEPPPP